MNYKTFLVFILLAIMGCHPDEVQEMDPCIQMTQNVDYKTEKFKLNYEIQFPEDYLGLGHFIHPSTLMPVFHKESPDGISFQYSFFCGTDCSIYFGDALETPLPDQLNTADLSTQRNRSLLDQKIEFCRGEEIYMVLYYNAVDFEKGKLFLKDEGEYKDALDVNFKNWQLTEVVSVLKSIRSL